MDSKNGNLENTNQKHNPISNTYLRILLFIVLIFATSASLAQKDYLTQSIYPSSFLNSLDPATDKSARLAR